MDTASVLTKTAPLPDRLTFSEHRLYAYVSLFVVLAVSIPWLCHVIHPSAGPIFLPLFFFVLLAGIFLGWRAGILVGLLAPLISYGLSGMPILQLLPSIIIQGAVCGLTAGLFRTHLRFGVIISLVGAIIAGFLAAFLLMALTVDFAHSTHLTWKAVQTGWPGIVLQLLLLPFIVAFLDKLWSRYRHDHDQR